MMSWYSGPGSTSGTPEACGSNRLNVDARKVNDSLYELSKTSGTPKMEILFFHGLQFGDSSDAHLRTWESEDGFSLWPQKLLVKEFPEARILCVSYDGGVRKSSGSSFDMHIIVENLISDILQGNIGQTRNCPVVLIGHCFGGLVIKKVCLEANNLKLVGLESGRAKLASFLSNVKGVFYYGTPHHGTPSMIRATKLPESPLLIYFKTLSNDASRLDFDFNRLVRNVHPTWLIDGLGESLPVDSGIFEGVVAAPEESARKGDHFNVLAADHLSICKPRDASDRRYYALTGLLHTIARNLEVGVPFHECHGLPNYAIGLARPALDVRDKLIGAATLGISGMGGIGKTTLAKHTFNTISKDYEYTCFVDNVKGIPGYDLEKVVLNHFHHNGIKSDKGSTQWPHLKDKKTLIAMDDIDSENQLNVLPKLQYFGTGSRVIMTSRDQEVFKFYKDCIVYEVDFLETDDAKKLFCEHAFGSEVIPETLIDNVNAMVKKCDRLPLTLEVIGRYLRGHGTDLKVWTETLNRLGEAQDIAGGTDDRVWNSLRVSTDKLSDVEGEMFVEAASIFFEQPLDRALAAWSTLSNNLHTAWRNLVSRSLVKEVSKRDLVRHLKPSDIHNEYQEIWVHEQLRDLAKKIANGIMESGSDETTNSILDGLHDNKVNPRTKCLRLGYSEDFHKNRTTLQLDSLAKLESLKYMDLANVSSKGRGKGLTRKMVDLKFEGARGDQLSKFPFSLNIMENLAVLELKRCRIRKKFSQALGNLTNLHILRLSCLEGLDRLPENFGSLRRLRQLELCHLSSMKLPKSFGNLVALEHLSFQSIKSLQLPEALRDVSSLVKLTIIDCEELAGLPDCFGPSLTSLKELSIVPCPSIKGLPQCLSRLPGLELLRIYYPGYDCNRLQELGDGFRNLSSRRPLLPRNTVLRRLRANFSLLSRPETLQIRGPQQFRGLPDDFGKLTALKELYIRAPELQTLPESLSFPKSLQKMTIVCPKLERLPESLGGLALLEELEIDVERVETLPLSVGSLHSLREMNFLSSVAKLLPESLGKLSSVEKIILDLPLLASVPESLGDLIALRDLSIYSRELQRLPTSFSGLKSLQKFTINSSKLESLPDDIGNVSSLQELSIRSELLERLPESLGQLRSLKLLTLDAGKRLGSLPHCIGEILSLREFAFYCDGHDEEAPNFFANISSFAGHLLLTGENTRILPTGLGSLSSLKSLTLLLLYSLETLPDELGMLSSLERLTILFCKMLKSLPDSLGQLSFLKEVNLELCPKLKTLPESLGRWSSCQQARPQGDQSDELMWQAGESSEPMQTEAMTLLVYDCPLLDYSVLESLGWMLASREKYRGSCYRRNRVAAKSDHSRII